MNINKLLDFDFSIKLNNRELGVSLNILDKDHSCKKKWSVILFVGYRNQSRPSNNWSRYFTYHHKQWFHIFNNHFDAYDVIADGWEDIFGDELVPIIEF